MTKSCGMCPRFHDDDKKGSTSGSSVHDVIALTMHTFSYTRKRKRKRKETPTLGTLT